MADILRPELIWIEGRCYRVNDPTAEVSSIQEHDLYEDEPIYNDPEEDDGDDDFEVVMINDSRYSTSLHVPKHYLGYLIGKKGATRSRIERDTRTEIKIPRQEQSGDIVIVGPSVSNVKAARRRINMIVMSSRLKQRPTHFLSIPVNSAQIIENFNKFQEAVLRECPDRGVEASIFARGIKLHLTLAVMCLMDNEERLLASKLLTEAKDNIIIPLLQGYQPLQIRLKGVSYMNDDPTSIDVLYGVVKEENAPAGLLQQLANALLDHFTRAGYADGQRNPENVKLHVTLMNTKFRGRSAEPEDDSESNRSRGPRGSFDGSRILDKFADFDFGLAEITDIHLSQLHTSTGAQSYYESTCVVSCKG